MYILQDRKNLLKRFLDGEAKILVCTDIASRGIDCSLVGLSTDVVLKITN